MIKLLIQLDQVEVPRRKECQEETLFWVIRTDFLKKLRLYATETLPFMSQSLFVSNIYLVHVRVVRFKTTALRYSMARYKTLGSIDYSMHGAIRRKKSQLEH